MTDPRMLYPIQPGERQQDYAARLTALRWPCSCGCGRPLPFHQSRLFGRSLYLRGHLPGDWRMGWRTPDRMATHARRISELWRAGHRFNGHWRGGIRAEWSRQFPECSAWLASLSDDDLAGLLATHEEMSPYGEPLSDALKNLLGEARDRAED
jgi:hypothetical protein